ncbi:C45 family autoproteolytic acyltransferase/hydolase [Solidesulfovibrio sp.]|uniref:C45 family autoproteolytic acyltransferase/hydolase n=1 Tax=Solidesulfovibrio sp. TaxID=2910990 RepID=UPI002B213DCA|nr:C45 family autoproteolytic acyltransferase/hydolase [Solidesulfovibrio sp.]MEA4855348.1 C45 family autoproteolytic acyltransferase/hydrolase [Solidesulfovibrio sp.]
MVTIERIDGTYYKTTLDFTKGSHFEVGQAYAQEIVNTLPSYGATIDLFLLLSSEASPEQPEFATLITRAYDLIAGMPQDDKDELAGMTTVFTYPVDKLGDGILSTNELLVFEVLHDVIDPGSCSAAAVYGAASATGSTIVGRNFDWYDMPGVSQLHNVQRYINADPAYDIVGIGFLGQLFPASVFSENHISGALLDSDMKRGYFTSVGADSYPADFRYAFEHFDNVADVGFYLLNQQDTHSYIGFLADTTAAYVLENDLEHPEARGLRTDDSLLREGVTWGISNTVAAVNSFLLPGTTDEFSGDLANEKRFDSYKALLESKLASENVLDMQDMQDIIAFTGTDGIAKNSGAIYRATNDYPTYQSYTLDMGSLELVANFGPTEGNPPSPTYTQVFASNPFL